jgi:hypothetical protein
MTVVNMGTQTATVSHNSQWLFLERKIFTHYCIRSAGDVFILLFFLLYWGECMLLVGKIAGTMDKSMVEAG